MSDLKTMYKTIQSDPFPPTMTVTLGETTLTFHKRTWTINGQEQGLRYGENPDQPAALYELKQGVLQLGGVTLRQGGEALVSGMTEEQMIQAGKHPGKINLTDVDNGINILQYLTAKPAAVILKHNNPCGAAWSDEGIDTALFKAFWADRIAAFGGAIVVNRPLNAKAAEIIASGYFEVVAAPSFEPGTVDTLKSRKNLRILEIPGLAKLETLVNTPFLDLKSLTDGGIIAQFSFRNKILAADDFLPAEATSKDGSTFIARGPSKQEADDLVFAWAVEAGVTSNSVIMAKNGVTTAIGTGEQDRVGCVELAIHKAYTKYADNLAFEEQSCSLYELKEKALQDENARTLLEDIMARTNKAKGGLPGSVMVSDGFFPFRDGVDVALAQGITAIAQPGGSIRDHEVIQAVNQAVPQVAMVFTGQRSFKH
ncbi:IMP cyclohydrolase [Desulfoplanes formicivorans]|uniref:IMP cyclohydrolase n=1 Tax=Desulfoplanes formicivorans TaxID=1592317 RepID=A0A194AFI3_9BACT|nr:IMP cyclohydrolase [Desulfoplanes formicivorans]GAU08832.1 IMP cyclohydrolase [Desulfoplanes formicivorans]